MKMSSEQADAFQHLVCRQTNRRQKGNQLFLKTGAKMIPVKQKSHDNRTDDNVLSGWAYQIR